MKTLLYNARIISDNQTTHGYIVIDDDTIETVAAGHPDESMLHAPGVQTIDCEGDYLIPGAIDTHVHFRDPGLTAKGDIETESRAAVAGGVTSYFDMPNTRPTTITLEDWADKMSRAAQVSAANYAFFIGATNDNLPTLLAADYSRVPGIKLFMGSSTGNMLVDNESMLDDLFAKSPAIIVVHAEDEDTIRANKAALEAKYPDGNVPLTEHSAMRSTEACIKASRRAVELARRHNARLHLAHISTAAELELLEPGDVASKRITAETCPHYLLFTDADIATRGARVKCNPAIKTDADRHALADAINRGLIDTIATDHAPHLPADKQGDLFHAASGMPGVQFSLPLMLSMGFAPELVARLTAHNPSQLFGIDRRGFLRPGYYADIVRVTRLHEPHAITDDDVVSRCGWTPFAGCETTFKVITTWVNGSRAYHLGHFSPALSAHQLNFTR